MSETEMNSKRVLSPRERRQRNREEMMAAILDAARAVMREQGVAALNLHEVARRVGLRTPSLYEYFSGKMALYDALFRLGLRLYAAGRERLAPLTPMPDAFWERAHEELEHYMTFAQENPEIYQLVFERPVPGFVPSEAGLEEGARILAESNQILSLGLAQDHLTLGGPPEQARDLFIAMMHGLTALHMANEPELPVGTGRFGSLIPAALALFQAAWHPTSGAPVTSPQRTDEQTAERRKELEDRDE
jgi:AcrR family transcriptional regulator